MKMMKPILWCVALAMVVLFSTPATAQQEPGDDDDFELVLRADLGFISPVYHKIQYSQDGTDFDYVEEGGQDVLFPFSRFSTELRLGGRHKITFVLQPLRVETEVRLSRDITVDDALFEEGRPMELLYNFPYYRTTYLYDLMESEDSEFALGGGLQIRNATIIFKSADGELLRDRRDVGLVPLLKVRGRHTLASGWYLGGEVAGFYAPIRYLNLRDVDVVGAIIDTNLEGGRQLDDNVSAYLSLRYIGGGSEGTADQRPEQPGDGFTRNWIHALALSIGFEYRF